MPPERAQSAITWDFSFQVLDQTMWVDANKNCPQLHTTALKKRGCECKPDRDAVIKKMRVTKMGSIARSCRTPNYPENVAEENSPESLVVRFAEPVGTEVDSCDSHKLSVSELSKRIHVEWPCFLSRTKAVRNRKPLLLCNCAQRCFVFWVTLREAS